MRSFNDTNTEQLHREVIAAVKAVFAKHDIMMEKSNMRYSIGTASFSIKAMIEPDAVDYNARTEYSINASRIGIPGDSIGKVFTHEGKRFKITNLNLRRRKHPVMTTCLDDSRQYNFSPELVNRCLAPSQASSKW